VITCTRRIQFCAGHRVYGHESKCAHLHGHNYVAFVTARLPSVNQLDMIGRVVDFSVLKELVGGWIDKAWDHGFILDQGDHEAIRFMQGFQARKEVPQKLHIMPSNPTAENMAQYLLHVVCPRVLSGTGVEVFMVRLWETENCYAEAEK
jgi:6-pyruvoyltetrahydropterin/6-carboxytetrahydropterin synthase